MYKKCLTFDPDNIQLLKNILNETNPNKIKQYGRLVENYDDLMWSNLRYNVMKEGLYNKFNQNLHLKKILLETENNHIYEASENDKIWGIGMNENNAKNVDPIFYKGTNLLGKALEEVREMLKEKI